MDYEIAYKEALNRAREIHRNEEEKRRDMEWLFPELKESDDNERIRKKLLKLFNDMERDESILDDYGLDKLKTIAWLEKQNSNVDNAIKEYWKGYREGKQEVLDKYNELEKQGEQKPNPYSGTSFEYNNHTWGMCARDGGIDILCDSKLIKHIGEQKPIERKEFTNIPFGAFDSELIEESITIPDGCVATIEGNKIHIKREYKTATEAIKEEKVDNAKKPELTFNVGDWITFYGGKPFKILKVELELNGILDYLLLDENGHKSYYNKKYVDKNARLWTINDAEDGDVLASENGSIILVKESRGSSWGYRLSYHCAVLYDGTFEPREFHVNPEKFFPASKEQRDTLMKAISDAEYEWDSEKKEVIKIEQV